MGRYANAKSAYDLEEYEGRLFFVPARGGSRAELRSPANGDSRELVTDDALSYGTRVRLLDSTRIVVDADTLRRVPRPVATIPIATPKPSAAPDEFTPLIGEYGWNHDVLFVREKDGQLNALIEWFFEYPLTRVSQTVYRFPAYGLYDGEEIVFRTSEVGPSVAVTANVDFKRRDLPADNDRVNAKIKPVRKPSEMRTEALAASRRRKIGPERPISSSCGVSTRRSSTTSAMRRRTTSWGRRSTARRTLSCSGRPPRRSRGRRRACESSATGCSSTMRIARGT
jgi:hypothetical protein